MKRSKGRPRLLEENHTRFLLRLSAATFDDVRAFAEARAVSVNVAICYAVKAYIKQQKAKEKRS